MKEKRTGIKGYSGVEVKLLRATENPQEIIQTAANMTMRQDLTTRSEDLSGLVKYLIKANHTSLFEHINYSFMIEGGTRSLLAQATRHRIASYTSGSQHYQNYSDYGFRIADEHAGNPKVEAIVQQTMEAYRELIADGVPKEEARQVLPNGMENNLMVTINARSLANFLNLRMCNRNTKEIKMVAEKMYDLVQPHFPEFFNNVGPDCSISKCRQGKLICPEKKYEKSTY